MFSKIKFIKKLKELFGRKTNEKNLVKYEPIEYIPTKLPPDMRPKFQFAELLKRVEATMRKRGTKIDFDYVKKVTCIPGIEISETDSRGNAPYMDVMLHPRKARKLLRTVLKGAPEGVTAKYMYDLEEILKTFKNGMGENWKYVKRNYFKK